MITRTRLVALVLFGFVCSTAFGHDITVAADGSGDFKTVQAAIDAVPDGNAERVVISIKNGTYNEQLRIRKSFLTLRGQDRKLTKITAYDDTSACPVQPGQSVEETCATVLADAHDIIVENLTLENTYKGKKGKGAALSFMGDSTRIVVSNVDIIGFGGDTFGLTARRNRIGDGGEYYVNNVYVSGLWHIIVPRGNTWVANSQFVCLGENMYCLFAEGITRERDKLAIVNSTVEGPQPFKLGSYFRDAAWYFIDDTFGSTLMADGDIYHDANKSYQMKWGERRVYFAGAKGPDYPWLKDNIERSPAKTKANVTAAWVLPEWNPESTKAPVIKSAQPKSATASANELQVVFSESVTVRGTPQLKWGRCTLQYASGSGTDTLVFRDTASSNPKACRTPAPKELDLHNGAIFASAASLKERHADMKLPK